MLCRVYDHGAQRNLRDVCKSTFFSLARFRACLADLGSKLQPICATKRLLSMENAAAEISLPILKAFLVSAQETIAIGLLINVSAAKDGAVAIGSTSEEVRTLGIVRLSAAAIVGSGKQAVLIASIVGAL